MSDAPDLYTAFNGERRIASGPLQTVALALKHKKADNALIFDDATGRQIDVDLRGSDKAVIERLIKRASIERARSASTEPPPTDTKESAEQARGRGRPKLGVVAREVTLLPRHWEWLTTQPGGASVALRKLVEEARRAHAEKDRQRKAVEAAYTFMSAISGNKPGFEEAIRALFAGDEPRVRECVKAWPRDIRDYALRLAFGSDADSPTTQL